MESPERNERRGFNETSNASSFLYGQCAVEIAPDQPLQCTSHETAWHEFIMEFVQYRFPPMLFTVLNNVVLTCENKGEILYCDNSSESYEGAFSWSAFLFSNQLKGIESALRVKTTPVCTPRGSKFSILQTVMQLSAASLTTSYSISFQPNSDCSIRI